jgi:hypothetical protein
MVKAIFAARALQPFDPISRLVRTLDGILYRQ